MSGTGAARAGASCARCGRAVGTGRAHWPEGYLCMTCYTHALETYGRCAGCGADRLTPGIAPDGGRLCTDCAGRLGDTAAIDWEAAIDALQAGSLPCSAGERRMLHLAASLADRAAVSLGEAVTGIDDRNVGLLVTAIRHAAGERHFPR